MAKSIQTASKDILQFLRDDHRRILQLFENLERTKPSSQNRFRLFEELKKTISAHSESEDEVLYSSLLDRIPEPALVLEAQEEHHFIETILEELEELPTDNERWLPKLKVLEENLQHHLRQEEGEIFAQAKELFERQELRLMGQEIQEKRLEQTLQDDLLNKFIANG